MSNNAVFVGQVGCRPGRRSSNNAFRCNLLRSCKFCNFVHFYELCLELSSVNAFFLSFLSQHMGNE